LLTGAPSGDTDAYLLFMRWLELEGARAIVYAPADDPA
jgi:hypothetical protein